MASRRLRDSDVGPTSRCSCREQLLRVGEVAEWLGVSVAWLYDEVEAGKFPVVRLGRNLRFSQDDIEAYLARSRRRPGSRDPARRRTI